MQHARGFDPSPETRTLVEQEIDKLERYFSRVVSCRVVVEIPHRSRESGNLYHVRVDVSVPGKELVVSRDPSRDERRRNVRVAVKDAFQAMRRQLEDHSQEVRGQVKEHEAPPHGRVVGLKEGEGYGFVESSDGRTIYFHENAVLEDGFDDLSVGEEVRFSEEEGLEGPQATAVWPVSSLHPVERRPRKEGWK